jgi:hypothetical protein
MERRKNAYLRVALSKLDGKSINLPAELGVEKDVLSRWWRTGNGNISISEIEEILNSYKIPKVEIKK